MRRVMTVASAAFVLAGPAHAAEEVAMILTIKDHKFEPVELKVPSSKAIKLTVHNLDLTAEELESKELGIEKVVGGKGTAVIHIKPLTRGAYPFVGEFHEDSAHGSIIAE